MQPTSDVTNTLALQKLQSDILLAEYKARTDEITHLSTRYSTVMMSAGVLISVVLVASGFSFQWLTPGFPKTNPELGNSLRQILAVVLPAFLLYLITSAMDALHLIMINGLRRAELEKRLNQLSGDELLIWDLKVIPELFIKQNVCLKCLWIKPNILVFVFLAISTFASFTALATELGRSFGCGEDIYRFVLFMAWALVLAQWLILIIPAAGHMSRLSSQLHENKLVSKEPNVSDA